MFKNPKLQEIAKLYDKITNEFNVNKVYVKGIFHPRDINCFINENVAIDITRDNCIDTNVIEFLWFDNREECKKLSWLTDDDNNDTIFNSIINALEHAYCDYKVLNDEVNNLFNKVGTNTLSTQILDDILCQYV